MTKTVADPFSETIAAAGAKGTTVARTAALPILTAESGLTRYLKEIRRFPMLEQQDEYMLAKRWREHGDRDAAHKLVTAICAWLPRSPWLSRLRPARLRSDLGGQCRPDAGGQKI